MPVRPRPLFAPCWKIMATFQLSESEREYIVSGVREDLRADGRTCVDYRHFTVRTGVVSNTSGSAKIEQGGSCAVIGVKAELGSPYPTSPDTGRIEFFVDCSALASPEFERRQGEELGQHLAHRLAEAFRNDVSIDLSSLSVIPGQQCWILYVDALVLEWNGGMVDVLSLGVRAALQNTLVPKLTVSGEGEEMEIEISDDPHDSMPVDASNAPIIVTLTQVGGRFVVDASIEEETCSTARLSLAVNKSGNILSVTKDGTGGIPYGKINDIISMGLDVSADVIDRLDRAMEENTTSAMDTLGRTAASMFD